jgi:hypothetical protein
MRGLKYRAVALAQVPLGWYSVGGDGMTRSAVVVAPPGRYAREGVLVDCPPGTYGGEPVSPSLSDPPPAFVGLCRIGRGGQAPDR